MRPLVIAVRYIAREGTHTALRGRRAQSDSRGHCIRHTHNSRIIIKVRSSSPVIVLSMRRCSCTVLAYMVGRNQHIHSGHSQPCPHGQHTDGSSGIHQWTCQMSDSLTTIGTLLLLFGAVWVSDVELRAGPATEKLCYRCQVRATALSYG